MNTPTFPLLSLTLVAPLLGAIAQVFVPERSRQLPYSPSRWTALAFSGISSLLGIASVATMSRGEAGGQLVEAYDWIGSYAIAYDVGLDGLNALFVLLVSVVFPVLIAAEWTRKDSVRGVHGLLLLLQFSLIGTACAQDLFLLFFFWALSALPVFFLVGYWGGPGREAAAFQGIVASALGNALFFGALVLVYHAAESPTFLIRELAGGRLEGKSFPLLGYDFSVSVTAFCLIAFGIAIRMPVWPLSGWLSRAAEEAPFSVLTGLAALFPAMGGYVFFRVAYSLFPQTFHQASTAVVVVGALSLTAGAFCASHQRGLRLLVTHLSVMGSGFVLIGLGSLSSAGIVGAVFQQLSLGLALAALGLLSGILQDNTGESDFIGKSGQPTMGGYAQSAPFAALAMGIVLASFIGFPGLSGFVGNSLLIIGSYPGHPFAVAIATVMLWIVVYSLFSMYRSIFLGKPGAATSTRMELSVRERLYLAPIVVLLIVFGLFPRPLVELVRPTAIALLGMVKE